MEGVASLPKCLTVLLDMKQALYIMIENRLITVMDYFAPYFKSSKEDYNIKVFFDSDSYLLLDSYKFYQSLHSANIMKKNYGLGIQSYDNYIWIQHIENQCLRF